MRNTTMATKHTLTAFCPFAGDEIDVEITYNYTPGRPARGPSYASGGEPADPPEVEFLSAVLKGAKLDKDLQERLDEWAEDLLRGDGYDDAVSNAEDNS